MYSALECACIVVKKMLLSTPGSQCFLQGPIYVDRCMNPTCVLSSQHRQTLFVTREQLTLKVCGNCKECVYSIKRCQKQDWGRHKQVCRVSENIAKFILLLKERPDFNRSLKQYTTETMSDSVTMKATVLYRKPNIID